MKEILLVGSGPMAQEHAKAFQALEAKLTVVGRGEKSAVEFHRATGIPVHQGGLPAWISAGDKVPETCVVCVSVDHLRETAEALIHAGARTVLLEKPGGIDGFEIRKLAEFAAGKKAKVVLGYNRRFYASVRRAREMIREDGGVSSFVFDFTEWSNSIEKMHFSPAVKKHWFWANSSHIADMAFFLGGDPVSLNADVAGELAWHPAASRFVGAGATRAGALFSYHANWDAPGRWSVELQTTKRKLIFRPLEKLQVCPRDSVAVSEAAIDDACEKNFKPGVFLQAQTFLRGEWESFCTLEQQAERVELFDRIAGYDEFTG